MLCAMCPASSVQVQEAASHWDYTNCQVTGLGPGEGKKSGQGPGYTYPADCVPADSDN